MNPATLITQLSRAELREELNSLRAIQLEAKEKNAAARSQYTEALWATIDAMPGSERSGYSLATLKSLARKVVGEDPGEFAVVTRPVMELMALRIALISRELGARLPERKVIGSRVFAR